MLVLGSAEVVVVVDVAARRAEEAVSAPGNCTRISFSAVSKEFSATLEGMPIGSSFATWKSVGDGGGGRRGWTDFMHGRGRIIERGGS